MSLIREIRKITTYEFIHEFPIKSKYFESYVQIGDEIGFFYVVKYKSGVTSIFNDFPALPKRARRIVRNSHFNTTEYYNNSEVKIWRLT